MTGKRRYNTPNREAIEAWFKTHEGIPITIGELKVDLVEDGINIATATLYRNIAQLQQEGFIIRTIEPGHPGTCYVYRTNRDGCTMRCKRCGKTEKLHCEQMEALYEHVAQKHNFVIDNDCMVLEGYCVDCTEKNDAKVQLNN